MEKDKLLQLKKKLFILAGYLMVTALLFVYVSYSQYKISMEATVRMPKVYTMSAGIELESKTSGSAIVPRNLKHGVDYLADDHTTTEQAVEIKGFLDELMPGNKAETYAASSTESQHKLVVKMNNKLEKEDGSVSASKLDIKYSLSIQTDGVLPLHFIMFAADGTTYSAVTTHTNSVQEVAFKDASGNIKEFYISAGAIEAGKDFNEKTHEIYVGWNNDDKNGTDIALCKEVEKIVVKAKITALPAPSPEEQALPSVILTP